MGVDQRDRRLIAQFLDKGRGRAVGIVVGDDDGGDPVQRSDLGEDRPQGALQTLGPAQGGDDDGDVGGHQIASA